MNEFCPIFKVFSAFSPSKLNTSTKSKHSFPTSSDLSDSKFERLNEVEFANDPSPNEMELNLARSISDQTAKLTTLNTK